MSENSAPSPYGPGDQAPGLPQYGAPQNADGGFSPAPVPPKKKRTGLWIAGGCGCLVLIALLIGGCSAILGASNGGSDEGASASASAQATSEAVATVDAPAPVPATSEAPAAAAPTTEAPAAPAPTTDAPAATADVPAEYSSALTKAESYSELLHMSKDGIYDQLTSEYGEKFSPEAAQYAVDTMDADWNANALAKAKSYQETMAMSPDAIHDQLTSEYGEKFTEEQADYAIEHLND